MASSQNKLELSVARSPELAKGLQRLRNDKKFCDFVIECSGVEFAVHRVVLCSRSEYFERMCSGEFKEAGKGTVKLVDEDPDMVSRMLDFMYGLVRQLLLLPYKATAPQATTSQINSALKEYLPQPTHPSSASPSPALSHSRRQYSTQPTYPSSASPSPVLNPSIGQYFPRPLYPQPTYPSSAFPSPALNLFSRKVAKQKLLQPYPQPTHSSFASPSPALSPYSGHRVKGASLSGARPDHSFIPQTAISDSVSTSPTSAHQNHALIHAQMYAMGEKYLTPDLKNHAKLSFSKSIRYISVASLCEVITEVYTSTPETDRGLRDIVLDTAVIDLNEMMRNKELKKIAIEMVPQFGYELLEKAFGGTDIIAHSCYE